MKKILKSTSEYDQISVADAIKLLNSNESRGLTTEEVNDRLEQYGHNDVEVNKFHPILDFFKRYWGPLPWLLEFTIVLTFLIKHYSESLIIFILLTINVVIGYIHNINSKKAVELLKSKLMVKTKVLRNNGWILVDARKIVPGDIISLRMGDLISADVKLISGEILVDDSALTGESLPKNLSLGDLTYSGSIVKQGESICIVVNTGINTYFGKTVNLVVVAKAKSKQEKLMLDIIKYTMYLAVIAIVVVTMVSMLWHKDLMFIISFNTIFLIGTVPVALPAVLAVVQAVGAIELSSKNALVTRIDSIEDAASIDVFCFDKTGTITQNKLSVMEIAAFNNYSENDVITLASLASKEETMDMIDLIIIEESRRSSSSFSEYKQISYEPFIPATKRTKAYIEHDNITSIVSKGALNAIIDLCKNINTEAVNNLNNRNALFSKKGYRTIAVAKSNNSGDFEVAGLIAIADPLRAESKELINEIKHLGIKPIMLTGDSLDIAKEISQQVGIGENVLDVRILDDMPDSKQLALVRNCDGFAGVYPEDKYKIVKLLQDSDHAVGMTGDGVNDAPALKQAQLGTAVINATDVAKSSASMVLTKDGFSGIVDAIKVSRKTYQRMLTWVINKVTKVSEIVFLFTIGFILTHDMVVSFLGMSLLVFVNDFATMSIATDNASYTLKPNDWHMNKITFISVILGLLFAIEDLLLMFVGFKYFNLNIDQLQTLMLLILVFNAQLRILVIRERNHFWVSKPSNQILLISLITLTVFVFCGIFGLLIAPIPLMLIFVLFIFTAIFTFVIDTVKYYLFKKIDINI